MYIISSSGLLGLDSPDSLSSATFILSVPLKRILRAKHPAKYKAFERVCKFRTQKNQNVNYSMLYYVNFIFDAPISDPFLSI